MTRTEDDHRRGVVLLLLISGLVIMITSFIVFAVILADESKLEAVKSWPSTTGTIEFSQVKMKHRAMGPRLLWMSEPVVEYRYEVDDKLYRGTRIWFRHSVTAEAIRVGDREFQADEVVERYPIGAEVAVYFNAEDPEDAVLELHVGASSRFLSYVSIVVAGMGLLLVLLSVSSRSKKKTDPVTAR